jgi:antibiotic biosynthesis monooxygenase (ABM) superfamily enzyme
MQESVDVSAADQPVTINIVRTVRPGRQEEFETVMRAFIPLALTFPGHLGVHVIKPARTARDYHVVIKFAAAEQWRSFQVWTEYERFRAAIEPLLEREACVKEMSGLESWLTLPHAASLRPLPRWKMALVTLLGVYPTSLLIALFVRPHLQHWPIGLQSIVYAACTVVALTWVIMPLLTRLLAWWLYPAVDEADASSDL